MKISYNWLSRYLSEIPSPQETSERLTLTGLEVEEAEQTGPDLSGIVVGEVLDVQPHPDADRLVVCQVDIGEASPSQIVCGAPNVASGQKVPVAQVGSILPVPGPDGKPFHIKKAKIRGQKSSGMICAEDELGLGDDHSGIMVLEESLKTGTPFQDIAGSERDTVFEIGLTPNRPDATCHLGVARDLAAVTGSKLLKPLDQLPKVSNTLQPEAIRITDVDKCHRYVGVLIRGVTVGESPQWLKDLLTAIGLRPVNNVVDISNFVLHELGQPLHTFDFQQLANGQINVQSFDSEQKFTTLDEVEHTVSPGSLFICDGDKPVALAGIMGGMNSEIHQNSTDILIESAWFEPTRIRKTARNLGLQTDSSYRFERGVDPNVTRDAALRCAQLILENCGGSIEGMEDNHPVKTDPSKITLRYERLNRLMGMTMDPDTAKGILERLEISVEEAKGQEHSWICTIPTFRPDITAEIDLIEEVARIYDYNNIPDPEHIAIAQPNPLPYRETFREKARNAAVSAGLKEIYTNSLMPERHFEQLGGDTVVIPTLNPITRDQALLRSDLVYGFLRSAAYNFNRKTSGVRFFEIGNIFRKDDEHGTWIKGVHEATHLHIGIAGHTHPQHWKTSAKKFDFFDLKSIVANILQHLGIEKQLYWESSGNTLLLIQKDPSKKPHGKTGRAKQKNNSRGFSSDENGSQNRQGFDLIQKERNVVGVLTSVDQTWIKEAELETVAFSAELDLGKLEKLSEHNRKRVYQPVSRYPSFEFDLALVVDKSLPAGNLEQSMYLIAGNKLVSIDVFDVFEGGSLEKDQKSIAFRLTFQDNEKTLTINDVDPIIQKILKKLGKEYGAELRS